LRLRLRLRGIKELRMKRGITENEKLMKSGGVAMVRTRDE
jgi:hypothetical protein